MQAWLAQHGVPVLDADTLAHQLYATDAELKANIARAFGPDVFEGCDTAQAVNRKALGDKVFGHPDAMAQLEGWIHPKVKAAIEDFYQQHQSAPFVVAAIPILFEKHRQHDFDTVWLVYATPEQQCQRLMAHRGLTQAEAQARLASQLPIDDKRQLTQALGGVVIENTGTIEQLHDQLDGLLSNNQISPN